MAPFPRHSVFLHQNMCRSWLMMITPKWKNVQTLWIY